MTNREVMLRFDGKEGEWRTAENGIPQGNPVSPILFNLFIAPLLKRLEEIAGRYNITAAFPTFIDDITIQIESDSWGEAKVEREALVRSAYQWAEENGVQFEGEKFEWMRIFGGEEREVMRIPTGEEKKEVEESKILGVWIDRKLKWKKQVAEKIAKAKRIGNVIRRLGKGGRGMGVENLRTMYLGTARATMEYGAQAWWKGQKNLADQMDKQNEQTMRRIGGHYHTAPGAAILAEAGIIPTAVRLDSKIRRRTIKAITVPKESPENQMYQRITMELNPEAAEWTGRADKIRSKGGMKRGVEQMKKIVGSLERVEKRMKTKEQGEWEKEVMERKRGEKEEEDVEQGRGREEEGEEEVVMYVDGAWKEGRAGAGVWREGGTERRYQLGGKMEAEDAEIAAIQLGLDLATRMCLAETNKNSIRIRSDCQTAVRKARAEGMRGMGLIGGRMGNALRILDQLMIGIKIEWVKGHDKSPGNKEADRLAKEAIQGNGRGGRCNGA